MVDNTLRKQLAQHLRLLVTGRLSNDDFDDTYYDLYHNSADTAVREISRFGWSLYSSDVLMPYYLNGRHAVDEKTANRAAHAFLFLHTDLAYPYPAHDDHPAETAMGCVWFNGLIFAATLFACGALTWGGGDEALTVSFVLAGLGVTLLAFLARWFQVQCAGNFYDEMAAHGDMQLWPFANPDSLASTCGSDFLYCVFRAPKALA